MEDKIVEAVEKVGFVKKHARGVKRSLIVVGGLAGLGIIGAIINNKRGAGEPDVWDLGADKDQFEKDFPTETPEE